MTRGSLCFFPQWQIGSPRAPAARQRIPSVAYTDCPSRLPLPRGGACQERHAGDALFSESDKTQENAEEAGARPLSQGCVLRLARLAAFPLFAGLLRTLVGDCCNLIVIGAPTWCPLACFLLFASLAPSSFHPLLHLFLAPSGPLSSPALSLRSTVFSASSSRPRSSFSSPSRAPFSVSIFALFPVPLRPSLEGSRSCSLPAPSPAPGESDSPGPYRERDPSLANRL